jgi:integral membrane protein
MTVIPPPDIAAMPLKDSDPSTPALFKWAAMLEGTTLLVLLGIAVPLKHLAGVPNVVSWVGPVHGVAFMVYIALACNAAAAQGWPRKRLVWTLLATMVPFGGFVIARSLARTAQA